MASENTHLIDPVDNNDSFGGFEHSKEEPDIETTIEEPPEHKTSNISTMMNLIKGNIGTGILAMPSAIKHAGLWVGFFGIGFVGVIAVHCMHLLASTVQKLRESSECTALDYGNVAKQVFENGPERLRSMGKPAKVAVNIFICMTQFGFCTIYILFMAENIRQVVNFLPNTHELDVIAYEAILLLFIIPFVFVKRIDIIAKCSSFANLLTGIGLVAILVECCRHLQYSHDKMQTPSFSGLALFFGTAVYAFEGIAVVLPLENKMKEPRAFRGLDGVLNTGMVIVTVMYLATGFFGYLRYGDDVKGSITLNLPCNAFYMVVRFMFAVAIFISYGLQFFVPADTFFDDISKLLESKIYKAPHTSRIFDGLIRIFFVLVTFILAAAIPHLDLMISLIGALASSSLALIFPPLLDSLICWSEGFGTCKWKLVKNVAIMCFGISGFIAGTGVTLKEIITNVDDEPHAVC